MVSGDSWCPRVLWGYVFSLLSQGGAPNRLSASAPVSTLAVPCCGAEQVGDVSHGTPPRRELLAAYVGIFSRVIFMFLESGQT